MLFAIRCLHCETVRELRNTPKNCAPISHRSLSVFDSSKLLHGEPSVPQCQPPLFLKQRAFDRRLDSVRLVPLSMVIILREGGCFWAIAAGP